MPAFTRAALVVLCAVIALDLSACGGTHRDASDSRAPAHATASSVAAADAELPANVVLRVGANLVSKQAFAHWMRVEAILSGAVLPQEEAGLREETAEILVLHYWVQEEATRAGIRLSAAEQKEAHRSSARLSASDNELVIGDELLLEKWHRAVLPVYARLLRLLRMKGDETAAMVNEVHAEIGALTAHMTTRWTPRTVCRTGYVMYLCGDYRPR
jgi:hypothetical protein